MTSRRNQLYLAHPCPADSTRDAREHVEADDYVAEMQPEEAAAYIASLLSSLQAIAAKAHLRLLSDLLSVAEEEAKFNCGIY